MLIEAEEKHKKLKKIGKEENSKERRKRKSKVRRKLVRKK